MLTNAQKALLKQAQREAGLDDAEYREALLLIAGCHSSTNPRMTNVHLDKLLAYFEAIRARKVQTGQLQTPCKSNEIFQKPGYWASKNKTGDTSRNRYLTAQIDAAEAGLSELGFGPDYCRAIREKVTKGRKDPRSMYTFLRALKQTLKSKKKALAETPF